MKYFLCLLLALVCSAFADVKFEDDISFFISFNDETPEADICDGNERPVHIFGKCSFVDGIAGKALVCGQDGAKIRFPRLHNIDFNHSGTIVFFYKGFDWDKITSGPRLFFWGLESSKGYIGGQLANDPKTQCPCQRNIHTMFLYGKRIPDKVLSMASDGEKGCGKWHLVAFTWSPGQFRMNYDRQPGKVFSLDFDMNESDFPCDSFSIGSDSHWPFLLDEFAVYKRRLSDAEIAEIYDQASLKK